MLSRIRTTAAEIGWFNSALLAINRLVAFSGVPVRFVRYYLIAQPVASHTLLSPRRGATLEVRAVQADDPVLLSLPLTPAVLNARFSQNGVCLGMFKEGRITGCIWFCFGMYLEDEVRCRFILTPPDRTAWDFDVYLAPEARGGIAFIRLWDGANAYLRDRGVEWSLSRISAFNPGSLASHSRLGARRIGSATFLKLGKAEIAFTAGWPFVRLSNGAVSVPEIRVNAPAAGEK